ncbi:MAG: hypothetical protein AMK72_08170 [Planctomycetes bacterium SM23_25]|nr:MAG: hypothetical protein AMK72_08170 [Planctomycetes bacterium SM23_25]
MRLRMANPPDLAGRSPSATTRVRSRTMPPSSRSCCAARVWLSAVRVPTTTWPSRFFIWYRYVCIVHLG